MNYGFIGFGNLAKALYQGLKDEPNINFGYFSRHKKEVEIPFSKVLNHLPSLQMFYGLPSNHRIWPVFSSNCSPSTYQGK